MTSDVAGFSTLQAIIDNQESQLKLYRIAGSYDHDAPFEEDGVRTDVVLSHIVGAGLELDGSLLFAERVRYSCKCTKPLPGTCTCKKVVLRHLPATNTAKLVGDEDQIYTLRLMQ